MPLLLRLLSLERTPQAVAAESESFGMSGRHWRRMDVLRHPLFWFLVPAILGPAMFGTAFFFHQVYFADIKGFSHLTLVALFPLYTIASVAMMLCTGFLVDRFGTGRLMPLTMVPVGLAFLVFSLANGPTGTAVGLCFMALTVGANFSVIAAFWAEFYGTRHLGAVKAMAAAVMVLGTAIGPILTGLLIDAGLPYERQMIGIATYFAFSSGLAALGISRAIPTLQAGATGG